MRRRVRDQGYLQSLCKPLLIAICLTLPLMGCGIKGNISRGYEFNDAAAAQVKVGMTVDRVLNLMGSPSTITTIGNKIFYYIGQHRGKGTYAFGQPLVEQRVMAVKFDSQFKVSAVGTYTLKDGILVPLHGGKTETESLDNSLFKKLFGGVGSFSPFGVTPEFKPKPSVSGN
jgi:outer membrane protein assembly factor BamE (lipoprotein component of BamABCDE complex)